MDFASRVGIHGRIEMEERAIDRERLAHSEIRRSLKAVSAYRQLLVNALAMAHRRARVQSFRLQP